MRPIAHALTALLLLATPAAADPSLWRHEWPRTDFGRSAVDLSEIISGGPGRDGIPALDAPAMVPASGETRIEPREPVLSLDLPGAAPRAYPVR